jgi:hypothetical protein
MTMPGRADRPAGLPSLGARLTIIGLLIAAALAVADRSVAGVTPRLVVASNATSHGQTLAVTASKQMADDPVGRVDLYVPAGFSLNSPAPGLRVGFAGARVVMRDLSPNAQVALGGAVTAIEPNDPTVAYEGSNCDPNQHLAAWIVQLTGKKGGLRFPIFVDATTGPTASFGPYDLVACFRPPDLPSGNPDRSADASVVDSFTLLLNPFFRPNTDGAYRWRSIWTPFGAGTGALNTTAQVEAQSIVDIPTGQIVIYGKKSTERAHHKLVVVLTISGQARVAGDPVGPVVVTIRHGSARHGLVFAGRVNTGSNGGYTKLVVLGARREYFQVTARLPGVDLGASGCQQSFANVPCVDATAGAGRTVSGTMLVKR